MDDRDIAGLLAELNQMEKSLHDCPGHLFFFGGRKPGQKVRCENCKGWMSGGIALFYAKGYEASGLPITDIIPDYYTHPLRGETHVK